MKNPHRDGDIDTLLTAGLAAQLEKLEENGHKPGFDAMPVAALIAHLAGELRELENAYCYSAPTDYAAVRREAADVANYAHMIVLACDRYRTMSETQEPA